MGTASCELGADVLKGGPGVVGLTVRGWRVVGLAVATGGSGAVLGVHQLVGLGFAAAAVVLWGVVAGSFVRLGAVRREDAESVPVARGSVLRIRYGGRGAASVRIGEQLVNERTGRPIRVETAGSTLLTPPLDRGRWRIGPPEVEWRDPAGTVRRRVAVGEEFEQLVRPVVVEPALSAAGAGARTAAVRPVDPEDMFEFHSLRSYVAGDDPRTVHWPASLRAGAALEGRLRADRLRVRQPPSGEGDVVAVLLDPEADGADGGEVFESAVDCAASLAVAALAVGVRLVLWCGGTDGASEVRTREEVLDRLTDVNPVGRGGGVERAARTLAATARGGTAYLVSTRPLESRRGGLRVLAERFGTVRAIRCAAGGGGPEDGGGGGGGAPGGWRELAGARAATVGGASELAALLAGVRS
ncbi:DUF58 domain-containing protein [Kitasatospora sp. NPDC048365]|uniref:DUF58 domain-containing protein n=1 Tax=Kitasatospora sp. NPDC048365 TaxID=3364050 RepID=UPI00371DC1D1